MGSVTINKTAFSAGDDKRIILENKINTFAIEYRGEKCAGAKRLDGRTERSEVTVGEAIGTSNGEGRDRRPTAQSPVAMLGRRP